jgi:hypothetical protein
MARGPDDLVDNVRQALLMALDGTFKGPPLQQDEASEAGEGGPSEAAEAEAAVARREGAKLEDLRDWRRKKGLTK